MLFGYVRAAGNFNLIVLRQPLSAGASRDARRNPGGLLPWHLRSGRPAHHLDRWHSANGATAAMILSATQIYASSNGDRWTLLFDRGSGGLIVQHEANPSSGGKLTRESVEAFLAHEGPGPEYTALKALLRQLAEAAAAERASPKPAAGRG
jgi:hypothetical protein